MSCCEKNIQTNYSKSAPRSSAAKSCCPTHNSLQKYCLNHDLVKERPNPYSGKACPGPCQCTEEDIWNLSLPPKPTENWGHHFDKLRRKWSNLGRRNFCRCCNCRTVVKAAKCKPCSSISSSELYEIKNYERDKSISSGGSNSLHLRFEEPIYEEEPMFQPCDHRGNTEIQSKQERPSSKECKPCAPSQYSFKHRKPCPPDLPDYCLCMPLPRSCNCPPPIQVDAKSDYKCSCECLYQTPECDCNPSERKFLKHRLKCLKQGNFKSETNFEECSDRFESFQEPICNSPSPRLVSNERVQKCNARCSPLKSEHVERHCEEPMEKLMFHDTDCTCSQRVQMQDSDCNLSARVQQNSKVLTKCPSLKSEHVERSCEKFKSRRSVFFLEGATDANVDRLCCCPKKKEENLEELRCKIINRIGKMLGCAFNVFSPHPLSFMSFIILVTGALSWSCVFIYRNPEILLKQCGKEKICERKVVNKFVRACRYYYELITQTN